MLGLHNMGRYGVRTEIRVVLHAQTIQRLPQLAEFIYRHLPFAEHVALMGLEYTGYTPHNDGLLWSEPSELAGPLEEAVGYLDAFGMRVSVYNLQHCVLPRSLVAVHAAVHLRVEAGVSARLRVVHRQGRVRRRLRHVEASQ